MLVTRNSFNPVESFWSHPKQLNWTSKSIAMIKTTSVLLICVAVINSSLAHSRFTPLEIDNHPCKPENLRHTTRYVCDRHGNVICQSGWREPDSQSEESALNPCLEPICDYNGQGCVHGECRAPNYCACEVGWEGPNCDICVPLPGCDHGTCGNAFECNCEDGWEGAYCDELSCGNCTNGNCIRPNECICNNGWKGDNCDVCEPMAGCLHGACVDHPHTCICESGWEGHLCDKPSCHLDCNHGFCHAPGNGTQNFCICQSGWRGESCDQCRPYWMCPNQDQNACTNPNECLCYGVMVDPEGLCNNTILIQKLMHEANGSWHRDSEEISNISG